MTSWFARTCSGGPSAIFAALVQDDDLLGEGHDKGHVMLDDEDRQPFACKHIDKVDQPSCLVGRKPAHRLVEHEQGRVHGERPRNAHKLSFAEGELTDGVVGPLFQAHEGEALHGDLPEASFLFSPGGEKSRRQASPRNSGCGIPRGYSPSRRGRRRAPPTGTSSRCPSDAITWAGSPAISSA